MVNYPAAQGSPGIKVREKTGVARIDYLGPAEVDEDVPSIFTFALVDANTNAGLSGQTLTIDLRAAGGIVVGGPWQVVTASAPNKGIAQLELTIAEPGDYTFRITWPGGSVR